MTCAMGERRESVSLYAYCSTFLHGLVAEARHECSLKIKPRLIQKASESAKAISTYTCSYVFSCSHSKVDS
eukprot:3877242-Amphidinium_carterae.2